MSLKGRTDQGIAPEELLEHGTRHMLVLLNEVRRVASRMVLAKSLIPIVVTFSFGLFWMDGAIAGIVDSLANQLAPGIQHEPLAGFCWRLFPAYLIAGAAMLTIWLVDLRYFHRLSLGLPERIRRAGIIERLAAGPGALPDIFAYTSFPWRLYLGARPKTFKHTARLLAANLDWYLLPEPRKYFRWYWAYLTCYFMFTIAQLSCTLASFFSVTQVPAPDPNLMNISILGFTVVVFLEAVTLLLSHEALRLGACAKALQQEVQLRLTGPGAAGGGGD
jgi:hypothetical protein